MALFSLYFRPCLHVLAQDGLLLHVFIQHPPQLLSQIHQRQIVNSIFKKYLFLQIKLGCSLHLKTYLGLAGKPDAGLIALHTPLAELKVDPEFSDYNQTHPEGQPRLELELEPRLELEPNQQSQIVAHREATSQLENEFIVDELKKPTVSTIVV